jgi:NAD(P)-dependent dehydrogenase (short-subunit alcohol dehydrogenase family)
MATILIAGANRGLGLEFVRQYATDGWEVLATARQPDKSEELKKLAGANSKISLYALDLVCDQSVLNLAAALKGKPIDLLILNSGVYPRGGQKIGQIDYQGWREAFETNVLGTVRVAETLLENVAASGRKQIAAISTAMSSLRSVQGGAVAQSGTAYQYRSTKAALNMAMAILAKEVATRGISVVMFHPGWVKTDMGGPNALLTPQESIAGMRKVLADKTMENSGKFLGHDGTLIPW